MKTVVIALGLLACALGQEACVQHPPAQDTRNPPPMTDDGWEVSSAEAEGLDSSLLENALTLIQSESYKNIHSMLIVKNNKLVLDTYYHGWNRNMRHDMRSASKSLTSALVGIALDKGILDSTAQPVWEMFPEYEFALGQEDGLMHVQP